MAENSAVVGIYKSHTGAEASIKELQRSGFDMKKLSIVGKDYHTEEHVIGYYNAGDRMTADPDVGCRDRRSCGLRVDCRASRHDMSSLGLALRSKIASLAWALRR
jgi:hypothetical protein